MSLDSVELVLAWENAFGIPFSDTEAERICNSRDVIDFFAAKLGAIESRGPCLSQRAFHRLRQGLVAGAAVPRAQVSPSARLRDLLPRAERQSRWQAAQSASGLPELPDFRWGFIFSSDPGKVADVVQWIVAHSPQSLRAANAPWTRTEVRAIVRAVVTEQLGISEFSDDDSFVEDLGID